MAKNRTGECKLGRPSFRPGLKTKFHPVMKRRLYYGDMLREYQDALKRQQQLDTVLAFVRGYYMVLRYFESAHNTYSDLTYPSQNPSNPSEQRLRPEYSLCQQTSDSPKISLSDRMRDLEISFVSTSVCMSGVATPCAKSSRLGDDSLRPEDLTHLRRIDFDKFAL